MLKRRPSRSLGGCARGNHRIRLRGVARSVHVDLETGSELELSLAPPSGPSLDPLNHATRAVVSGNIRIVANDFRSPAPLVGAGPAPARPTVAGPRPLSLETCRTVDAIWSVCPRHHRNPIESAGRDAAAAQWKAGDRIPSVSGPSDRASHLSVGFLIELKQEIGGVLGLSRRLEDGAVVLAENPDPEGNIVRVPHRRFDPERGAGEAERPVRSRPSRLPLPARRTLDRLLPELRARLRRGLVHCHRRRRVAEAAMVMRVSATSV
ncbi:hypothetical protein ACSSVZ_005637, partial [Amorphus sp. MBR-141]